MGGPVEPATEEVYFQIAEAKHADVARAVGAARTAYDDGRWPTLSDAERAGYLRAIGEAVRERTDDVLQIRPRESGVMLPAAPGMMGGIPDAYGFYADLADSHPFESAHAPTAGGDFGMIAREPVGVVGAIIPWDAPMTLIAYKLAPVAGSPM